MPIVYFTVFLDLLGFGLILPLLPYYAKMHGATGVWLGALLTAYSAAQFIGAPIVGRLSDRHGRRPVLLLTLAGSVASMTLAGFADSLGLLLVARLLAGLFGGSISAAQAFIADRTQPHERSKYMGILGACIGMGFVFGPAFGAALAPFGFGAAAFAAAGLAAINLVWAFFKLPESRPAEARVHARRHFSLKGLGGAFSNVGIRPILGATFLVTFGFVTMETTYALLGAQLYDMNAQHLGLVFTFVGVIVVIVQGGLIGRLTKKVGERPIALVGTLCMAAALPLLPFAPTLGTSLVVLGLLSVGQALCSPTLSTMLSRSASADEQGGTLGLGQSLAAAARATGPLAAGWLYDQAIPAPFLVAGGACLMATAFVSAAPRVAPGPAAPAAATAVS